VTSKSREVFGCFDFMGTARGPEAPRNFLENITFSPEKPAQISFA
jgi:hypothetical protein